MRSSWSAERLLGFLTAATSEGAWLTLAYVVIRWSFGANDPALGIVHFGVAAGVGSLLARIPRWSRTWYAIAMTGTAVLAAVGGVLLGAVVAPDAGGVGFEARADWGGWLLGVGVLRGSLRGDPDDEARIANNELRWGIPSLVAFWIFAALGHLADSPVAISVAFAGTMAFVSASLLSLGLARIHDLGVEAADTAARRRWIVLLLAVTGLILVIGTPLAALLGVPAETAILGALGPIGLLLLVMVTLIAVPIGFLLEGLARLLPPLGREPPSLRSLAPLASQRPNTHVGVPGPPVDLTWLLWLAGTGALVLLVLVIAVRIRPPIQRVGRSSVTEVREAERISVTLRPRIPRLRRFPRGRATPRDAIEAYRRALAALATGPGARSAGETPREHARRIAPMEAGHDLGRLAVDYQLAAFGGRRLSEAEERRAVDRWRRIVRRSR